MPNTNNLPENLLAALDPVQVKQYAKAVAVDQETGPVFAERSAVVGDAPNIPVPPFWGVYFTVTDTDATVERVKELGGNLVMGPMDIEPGRFAVPTDPTGAAFNVITMNPEQGSA